MAKRVVLVLVVTLLALGIASCSRDDDAGPAETSTAPDTTFGGTTVVTIGPTQTTPDGSSPSTNTEPSIPPVTPPADQPAACTLLGDSMAGAVAPTELVENNQPNGQPAPSTGCRATGANPVALALYYGTDPLEILAVVRQEQPGGTNITGLGQDSYLIEGVLFVDTGSLAFAVGGGPTQEGLEALAQNLLTNL